jgi:hypothetical protein
MNFLRKGLYKILQILRWIYLVVLFKKVKFISLFTDSIFPIENSRIRIFFDIKNAYKIVVNDIIEVPFYKVQLDDIINEKLDLIKVTVYGINGKTTKQIHLKSQIYIGQTIEPVKWNQLFQPKFKNRYNLTSVFSSDKKIVINPITIKSKNISVKQSDLTFRNVMLNENELAIIINDKTNQP